MSYNKNYQNDPERQAVIVRQSMLKAAVDYAIANNINKLTEIIGIGMAFSEYAEHGSYETAKVVEAKLGNKE
jgi:hypothetical protein